MSLGNDELQKAVTHGVHYTSMLCFLLYVDQIFTLEVSAGKLISMYVFFCVFEKRVDTIANGDLEFSRAFFVFRHNFNFDLSTATK